jgi:hypothetical protein
METRRNRLILELLRASWQARIFMRLQACQLRPAGANFIVLFSRYRSAVLALIIMGNVPLAFIDSVLPFGLRTSRYPLPR